MKKIILVSPHFPPSNLAAVHRARLFAKHLSQFEWEPIILTVHEKYYEEPLDTRLESTLPIDLRIEKVKAFRITKPRFIGDIGLRAFFQLYKRARQLIKKENIDFLYILIPSFYCALLGRLLKYSTGIKYGIDYIDPWVHNFPGSEKMFSRHWWSTRLAAILEPIAVKKTSLITGVAESYYAPVITKNPHLIKQAVFGAMPYGAEETDIDSMLKIGLEPYLLNKKYGITQLVYAGAMLPKAYTLLEAVFTCIKQQGHLFSNVQFHFIGTGKTTDDPESYNIKPLAEKYGLWQKAIFEYPMRIPYLDVLCHLNNADGILILGSTLPHYTPSKIYQSILAAKPIFAILNRESSAVEVLEKSNAGILLSFSENDAVKNIEENFVDRFTGYLNFSKNFKTDQINYTLFEKYSAKNITGQLALLLNQAS